MRRQSQRLGWRIHGSRIKHQRKIVFDWSGSWDYIRESWGRIVAQLAWPSGHEQPSKALRRRLWVSCSKTQWHKKPWTSTHFCRCPLGIIVFDVVKGTSVMTGTFSRVPWDVDLALCPRSFTEARPNSQHTHTTHTYTLYVPPTFPATALNANSREVMKTRNWRTVSWFTAHLQHTQSNPCSLPKIS